MVWTGRATLSGRSALPATFAAFVLGDLLWFTWAQGRAFAVFADGFRRLPPT
jgi:hypothetical protein